MFHRFIKYLLKNQVILTLFLVVLFWLIIQTREIIVSIFIAYIIMAAVRPVVLSLRAKGIPRVYSVLIPYFAITITIFLLIIPLVPFVISQILSLAHSFPRFINRSAETFGFTINPRQLEGYVNTEFETLGKSAVGVTTKVFGGLFSTITIFVVSLYLLLYEESFKKFFVGLFHENSRIRALEALDQINLKLGAWVRGQIFLCLIIGLFSWVGLSILGLPYALPLALIAGILEALPTIGPILSAVPAIVVALTVSPTMALAVTALYVLIQSLENQFIVPKVMEKAVGLNPVIIILAIMIGANLMGVLGALLAIPFVSFLVVLFKSIESKKSV